jgi:hypothetical protein
VSPLEAAPLGAVHLDDSAILHDNRHLAELKPAQCVFDVRQEPTA